jgi:hypothetical protein
MAGGAAQRFPGPRLFQDQDPILLRRTRMDMAELVGLVWLCFELVRLARSRLEKPRRR